MKTKNPYPLFAHVRPVASECGLSYEAVRKWALRGEVPAEHLAKAVRVTKTAPRLLAPGLFRQIDEAESAWAQCREPQ